MTDQDIPEQDRWAMQTRCVHCGQEQYAAAVVKVSAGIAGCTWCGRRSEPMTCTDYQLRLAQARR